MWLWVVLIPTDTRLKMTIGQSFEIVNEYLFKVTLRPKRW